MDELILDLEIPDFDPYPEVELADVPEIEIQIYFANGKKSTFSIPVSLDTLEPTTTIICGKDLVSMVSRYAF